MFIHVYIMTYFMLYSRIIYKITIITFFKLPLFICLYNDLTCITHLPLLLFSSNLNRHYFDIYIAVFQFHVYLTCITYLLLLFFSSNLNRQYYNIYAVFQFHLQNYRFYFFQATSFHIFV